MIATICRWLFERAAHNALQPSPSTRTLSLPTDKLRALFDPDFVDALVKDCGNICYGNGGFLIMPGGYRARGYTLRTVYLSP